MKGDSHAGIFVVSYAALWLLVLTQTALIFLLYRHFGIVALGTVEGVERDGFGLGERSPALSGLSAHSP